MLAFTYETNAMTVRAFTSDAPPSQHTRCIFLSASGGGIIKFKAYNLYVNWATPSNRKPFSHTSTAKSEVFVLKRVKAAFGDVLHSRSSTICHAYIVWRVCV